jgi:hypothetical protein
MIHSLIRISFCSLWCIGHLWNTLFHFSFLISQSIGLLGRRISPLQVRYLQKTTRSTINADIHASGRIRTHDPRVLAGEDSACIRPRGHCDQFIISSINPMGIFPQILDVLKHSILFQVSRWNLSSWRIKSDKEIDSWTKYLRACNTHFLLYPCHKSFHWGR